MERKRNVKRAAVRFSWHMCERSSDSRILRSQVMVCQTTAYLAECVLRWCASLCTIHCCIDLSTFQVSPIYMQRSNKRCAVVILLQWVEECPMCVRNECVYYDNHQFEKMSIVRNYYCVLSQTVCVRGFGANIWFLGKHAIKQFLRCNLWCERPCYRI